MTHDEREEAGEPAADIPIPAAAPENRCGCCGFAASACFCAKDLPRGRAGSPEPDLVCLSHEMVWFADLAKTDGNGWMKP